MRFLSLLFLAIPAASLLGQRASPPPGVPYLFVLDLAGTALDEFPGAVKALNGTMTVVDRDGQHMLRASSPSELLITLPAVLPAEFTVEVDLIPKSCCAPEDLMLEGTPARNRGVASAELTWHSTHIMAVGGGGEMYQSDMPADLAASTPGTLTHVVVEVAGPTVKLYTNGRRMYTLDKQFARGRVLRVWLGGQDEAMNAVYLAGLRIGMGPVAPTQNQPQPTPPPVVATTQQSQVPGSRIANAGLAPAPSAVQRTVTPTNTTTSVVAPTRAASSPVPLGFTVTVTAGPQGPVVTWPLVPHATGYTVTRSKSDDLNCCNASSGRTWGATSPWQDGLLPMPGTYVYTVLANTALGQMQAQTQYILAAPVIAAPVTPAPVTAVLATSTTTGTITPASAPAPAPVVAPASTATGGQILTPTRPAGTTTQPAGAPPSYVGATPTPVTVTLFWSPPYPGDIPAWSGTFEVRRTIKGQTGGPWTLLTPTPATRNTLVDVPPDRARSYTYEVTAVDPNGARGAATVDVTLPDPVDPSWFTARAIAQDEVELTWYGRLPDVKDYFLTGAGTGNGMIVNPTQAGADHHWVYTLKGIPSGTHTWTVAADYQPGGILTAASQWPKATLSMAASGKYQISVESVLASSATVDDILDLDGKSDEMYVTALVRAKDQAGNVVSESSYRSATYGDVANWPTRVRAGSGRPSGGIFAGDQIVPIWNPPAPGAAGTPFVLWSGTLTAGMGSVEVAPAVWESDDRATPATASAGVSYEAYDDVLRRVGYGLLDLDTRTAYGDISNVMLSTEHDWNTAGARSFGYHLLTPQDRPIGIAKNRDPLDDNSAWFPFGVKIDQSVAEAALGGSYGPPGLIPIVVVDHKIMSRDTFTHPDLGMGRYTLNIRITRLP